MGPGTRTDWQHARRHPDGAITIFDNGGVTKDVESRGIVVEVDEDAMRATLVGEYTRPVKTLAATQGNMRVLPNGNVFVGWGSEPFFSEFSPNGELLFDARSPPRGDLQGLPLPVEGVPGRRTRHSRRVWAGRRGDPLCQLERRHGGRQLAGVGRKRPRRTGAYRISPPQRLRDRRSAQHERAVRRGEGQGRAGPGTWHLPSGQAGRPGVMGKDRFHFRWFETAVVLAGVASFASLGPFGDAFAAAPGFCSWLPGSVSNAGDLARALVLRRVFLRRRACAGGLRNERRALRTFGPARAYAQTTLSVYLWVCGAIVAVSLLAAAVVALRPEWAIGDGTGFAVSDRGGLMWVPFVALVAALACITRFTAPSAFGDIWIYLSWVREYLDGGMLASVEPFFGDYVGLSRARINGWILEQTAVARVSGVDPVHVVFSYVNPTLAVVAFLVSMRWLAFVQEREGRSSPARSTRSFSWST